MNKKRRQLESRLKLFADEYDMKGRGPLSVALILTRSAKVMDPPYDPKKFLTPKGGQVKGLSGSAVQSILVDYGITRVLSEEGGRTSRGSIERMRGYVELLNELYAEKLLDFNAIELWWVQRIRDYYATQPFRMKLDASKSIRHIVSELIEDAFARQKECPGMMVAGAVMEHLVGAKLKVALPDEKIEHKGFTVADSPGGRKGDFIVHDTVIHVTTAPTESLIRKCSMNLGENLRPIIITTETGAGGARALARNAGLADRVDVLDIEQFIATNVYEWSRFIHERRPTLIAELISAYNEIIDDCEADSSLKITV